MALPTFEHLRDELKENGLVFVRNFIPVADAIEIKKSIENSVQKDLSERAQAHQIYGRFDGSEGITHNNLGKHIITDYFGRSSKLDQAIGKIFANETLSCLFKFIGGENLKLRGYNTRRMNGVLDYSAMEWHRDNVGEFTIGIVLTESGKSNDSSTCYIPGSHLYPYCPFKEAQFSMPHPIPMPPLRERFFSRLLEKKTTARAQNAIGQPGDIYVFFGELWHGRRANFVSNHDVVFFVGLFPSEIPFPSHSEVNIPSEEILSKLPQALRRVVDFRGTPPNEDQSSYIYELHKQKQSYGFFSLWNLVKLEIRFWKCFNEFISDLNGWVLECKTFGLRVVRKIRRSF